MSKIPVLPLANRGRLTLNPQDFHLGNARESTGRGAKLCDMPLENTGTYTKNEQTKHVLFFPVPDILG
jgi:hypothetical protein